MALGHSANPRDADDAVLLRVNGDIVLGTMIANNCGTPVRPMISRPATDVAVVVEADPTGSCFGSSLPSSVAVMLRVGGSWQISASAPATGFRVEPMRNGRPEILVVVPGRQSCPVLGFTGRGYEMIKPCPR